MTHIPRIGIGGPVGSGKSMLIERLVPMLAEKGYSVSIISNDVISKEDADRMRANLATKKGLLPENLVIGLATGGCPHTAIREDPSMNLSVIEEMESKYSIKFKFLFYIDGSNPSSSKDDCHGSSNARKGGIYIIMICFVHTQKMVKC